jgi:hypothetical protein
LEDETKTNRLRKIVAPSGVSKAVFVLPMGFVVPRGNSMYPLQIEAPQSDIFFSPSQFEEHFFWSM